MPVADLSEPELVQWGQRFARGLQLPALVTLSGDLGTGKTTLVRAMALALGARESVTSPSYGLVREYLAPQGALIHVDLYRLDGPEQLPQLGWEEIVRSRGLVLVEWPERATGALPAHRVALALAHVEGRPDVRRLTW